MDKCVKETAIQFGEGGFLRGFVDYLFHRLQEKGLYDGKIVVVQPVEEGMCQMLSERNCEYNLFLRGIDNGQVVNERTHVASISRALNLYTQYEEYISLAENPDLRVLVSNITEAGIEYLGTEKLTDMPPKSYPARLTQFLYKRFKAGLKGLILLSYELIDNNGDSLKKYVPQHAELQGLGDGFKTRLEDENGFCSTLIDHVVTGYPRDEVGELTKQTGYEDKLINTTRILHLWVIGGHHEDELPFQKADYNIVWTDGVHPCKKKKVRILNGGHTSMILGAYLYGLETIGECVKDGEVSAFLKKCVFEEIIPTIGDTEDGRKLGAAILERSSNPFVKHQLLSIALNSVNKFQVRVLPTILEYKEEFGHYLKALTFSMAALMAFYRTDKANDGDEMMQFVKKASVREVIKRQDYWHTNLSEMIPMIEEYYELIQCEGIAGAYEVVLRQ